MKVGRLVGGIRREVSFVRKLEEFAVNAEPRGKKTERYRSQDSALTVSQRTRRPRTTRPDRTTTTTQADGVIRRMKHFTKNRRLI